MIHLALRTEYSFKSCFGHLKQLVDDAAERGDSALGIADLNNTFGHIKFEKYCKAANIKPIFGVRLAVTDELIKARSARQSYNFISEFIFLAKNSSGLIEINKLVNTAYDNFYYIPRLYHKNVVETSENVIILAEYTKPGSHLLNYRINYFISSPARGIIPDSGLESAERRYIYVDNNRFSTISKAGIYELLSSPRTELQTYPQHILTEEESLILGVSKAAICETEKLASEIENVAIPHAKMVKYSGDESVYNQCIIGALNKGIDLDDPKYSARLKRELLLIDEKDYGDYFLIVADVIKYAKENMFVGPGRGSSAGSLVCYLMGITEIDPLEHGLLFERFIDINRFDLPDIDTDFADYKRPLVIKYLSKKYGIDNVKSIGTIATMKPKSAIGEFAKAMGIPAYDTDDIKNSIIERSGGDARAQMCILDTLEGTDAGRKFIKKYPEMELVSEIEGHARHSGKHAAGVIVSNDPLYKYGGIDSRENIVMMDKKDAESIGLLKIDILGLRTLAILEETANLARFDYNDFYTLKLDDPKVFDIFNKSRLYGVFQFEGQALRILTKQMGVNRFNDIVAITALARPGALNSGGAAKYVKYHTGIDVPEYFDEDHKRITEETYSTVVYQEQMMMVAKDIGGLSWEDVSDLRKAASKSLGDEFFSKFKEKFVKGAKELKGYSQERAEAIWKDISSSGSWSFNKSHAVSYSLISYWTAYCKAYYPLEFAAANLNHARDDESAIRILRDFVINDGIEYTPIDPDESDINWTIHDGKLLGGLTNLKGIGIKKAQKIIGDREVGAMPTPAIAKMLMNPITPFDILFPTDYYFGRIYENPQLFGLSKNISEIKNVNDPGEYLIIGKVTERDLRDRNDVQSVIKRGGTKVEENQFYLNLYVSDDTDSIKIMIPPFKMDELHGLEWAEKAVPDKTWLLIKGRVRDQWRSISVDTIHELKPGDYN